MTRDPKPPMEGWKQTRTLDLLRELTTVAGQVSPAVAARAGLSHSELRALEHLMAGPLGPVEVGRRLKVTSAATTGIVDRLVSHGHAVRSPHPSDRRRTEVRITDSGRAEVLGYLMPMFRGLAAVDAALPDEHREAVERYLEGATAAFRSVLEDSDTPAAQA